MSVPPSRSGSAAPLVARYDAVLLDLDGVVYLGDQPVPAAVEAIAEIPDGPPLRFRWRNVLHHVVMADGPERIAPEWWRLCDPAPTRDYFRVQDCLGRRFWIFRAGLYGREDGPTRWYMHGSFA